MSMQLRAVAGKQGTPGARVPAATQHAPQAHAPGSMPAPGPSLLPAGAPAWLQMPLALQQQLHALAAAAAATTAAASMPTAAASMPAAASSMPTAASADGAEGMDKGAAETLPSKLPAPVQSLEDLNKSRAAAPIFNKVAAAASAGTIFKSQATSSNAAGKDPAEHAAGSAESPVVIADGADGGTAVEQTASVPKRNPSRDAKKGVQIAENISKFGFIFSTSSSVTIDHALRAGRLQQHGHHGRRMDPGCC